MKKILSYFLGAMFLSLAFSSPGFARFEVRRGILHRTLQFQCTNRCDEFYIDPDPGFFLTYLQGPIGGYVNLHVEAIGYVIRCSGCTVLLVTEVRILPMVGVDMNAPVVPEAISLGQNFPNPFNPETRLTYAIPAESHVTLRVLDLLGREIETLVVARQSAGMHEVVWNASGRTSGIYLCCLSIFDRRGNRFVQTKKMVLLR